MDEPALETWTSGDAYERFMGRWSQIAARQFVAWLGVDAASRWLEVGCGSGALTRTALELASPSAIVGVEPSAGFVTSARRLTPDACAEFTQGNATALPFRDGAFDVAVSGLVLNFVPDAPRALAEMARTAQPGGTVAAYVWDYSDGMEMLRYFWDAAAALDPAAAALDEGRRFPLCRPGPLIELFRSAGLAGVEVRPLDVPTVFRDFEDYWAPFLSGQGPAPGYAVALTDSRRSALKDRLAASLSATADGTISLTCRAWAVRGTVGRRTA